jgi:hypothetical protein
MGGIREKGADNKDPGLRPGAIIQGYVRVPVLGQPPRLPQDDGPLLSGITSGEVGRERCKPGDIRYLQHLSTSKSFHRLLLNVADNGAKIERVHRSYLLAERYRQPLHLFS